MLVDYGMCVSACLRLISPDHVVDTWLCCLTSKAEIVLFGCYVVQSNVFPRFSGLRCVEHF